MPIDAAGLEALNADPLDEEFDDDNPDLGLTGDEPEAKEPEAKEPEAKEPEAKEPEVEDPDPTAKEPEVKTKPDRSNHMIPQHRYNYAKEKREQAEQRALAAEQELEELRAAAKQAGQPSVKQVASELDTLITELDTKIEQARADNDVAEAAKLRGEQRLAERRLNDLSRPAPVDPNVASEKAVEQIRVSDVISSLEKDYPILDESNEAFDAELSEEVMDTFEGLAMRMPRDQALARAARYVLKANGISGPAVKNARKTDVKKNANAAAAQPPDLSGVGLDSNKAGVDRKLDVMSMSQEDFEKLGDAEIDKILAGT